MKTSRIVIVLVSLVFVILVCVGVLVLAYVILAPAVGNVYENIVEGAASTGEQFLQALADGDFATAYDLCTPELQQELGSTDQLAAMFGPSGLQIESWHYETQPMTLEDGRSGFALVGDVTFSGGKTGTLSVVLVHVDEAFRVAGFSVEPE
jgi:hypothetical protein